MEDRPSVSLAKARIYAKIDEIERNRKPAPPKSKRQTSPVTPLTVLFVFLIVVIIIEERAIYKAEAEITMMKMTIAEQAEVIRISGERILAYQAEAENKIKPEPAKRRPNRRKPKASAQALDYADGYGLRKVNL
jgi:hypothetical protein